LWLITEVVGETTPRESVPASRLSSLLFFLLHASKSSNIERYFLFGIILGIDADLYVLDIIFIFFEFCVGFLLGVEMGKDLIVDPQFKSLTLLDDVESKTVKSKGVLEGYV
jgi:membrane protease YdiL (CAAX protease family)